MSAGTQIERLPAVEERRARGVWLVLSISTVLFLALCLLGFTTTGSILNSLTVPQGADLEPRANSQLVVLRNHLVAPESVSGPTRLGEGDRVETRTSLGAVLTLFDGSTIQLYLDTAVELDRMRTSRFFRNSRDANIIVNKGTVVMATAGAGEFAEAHYTLASGGVVVAFGVNTKVRMRVEGEGAQQQTSVTVDYGTATVSSRGTEIALAPRKLVRAVGGRLEGPLDAEEDLIRNGNLTEPPTNGAELIENGGLGTAGWLPIRVQSDPPIASPGTVELVTEKVGTQEINAVRFTRGNDDPSYTLVGMRQEINRAAEFLNVIELNVTVKVVVQSIPAAGPRGDLFPLTVRIIYRDGNGIQHEQKYSFYHTADEASLPNATRVQLGTWTTAHELKLKSADSELGLDIQVIEAIEVYGFGRGFESWVTGLALLAR